MANVYIETRPKGRREEGPVEDYVVEDHSNHVLATFKTQREAIDWAIKNSPRLVDWGRPRRRSLDMELKHRLTFDVGAPLVTRTR